MERVTARTVQPVIQSTLTVLNGYQAAAVTNTTWQAILRLLWHVVEPATWKVAEVSRDYYDEEYKKAFPLSNQQDVYLATPRFEHFARDMERFRSQFMAENTPPGIIQQAALRAARTVENAGRRTIIRAVEDLDESDIVDSHDDVFALDDEDRREARKAYLSDPNKVKGWARVPTGRETCSWCLMLCSRPASSGLGGYGGVLYSSFNTAGGKGQEREALAAYGRGEKVNMDAWHAGCDCKVVPIFNLQQWEGKELADNLYKLWRDVTARESGQDALNAFRRAINEGKHKPLFKKHRAAIAA